MIIEYFEISCRLGTKINIIYKSTRFMFILYLIISIIIYTSS